MDDLDAHLDSLDPELARSIRESASRAGLQSHDPAARMIAEMWMTVAALRRERDQLSLEMAELTRRARHDRWYLLALVVLGSLNLLAILALLSG